MGFLFFNCMNMHDKIIVNFVPTGMVPTKEITPNVPVSSQEIIEQTHEAYEIGITIAHLHAREEDETPSYKKNIYREIFEGVRKHCPELVICGSSSGRTFPEFEKRSEVIELQPDMCSLTLSSLNFVKQASMNAPDMVKNLAMKMKDYGVTPELECFDLGMINYGKYLINKKIVEGPFYWNLIFGNIAGMQADIHQIATAVSGVPDGHYIGLGGLADKQLMVNSIAISLGYGVRVGIEDNIWWDTKRTKKCRNIDLIKRIHQIIEINQKAFFNPEEFGKQGFYNDKRK